MRQPVALVERVNTLDGGHVWAWWVIDEHRADEPLEGLDLGDVHAWGRSWFQWRARRRARAALRSVRQSPGTREVLDR